MSNQEAISQDDLVISMRGIEKVYDIGVQKVHALRGIDLDIRRNEYVAIMGPSGSGKSTLMNLVGALDRPTAGIYLLEGEDVSKMHDNKLAQIRNQRIGFVFQTFNLLSRASVLHNVELPMIYSGIKRRQRRKRAMEIIEKVGLAERSVHKPSELSGGQRQRVAIARALVNNPSLILADEPTGNLDSKTGREIMSLFRLIHNEGNTIILVTHEEYIALEADRIIRLLDGKIISDKRVEDHSFSD